MRHLPVVERVRRNAYRLMHSPIPPHRTKVRQHTIAKALGVSVGQVSNFLRGADGIALKHLDPLAEVLGVPPSELVRQSELPLFELTEAEARLIHYYRDWTPAVRDALLTVFDFLHERLPSDPQTVRMFDYWRRLEPNARDLVYGQAVRLNDEGLPPDIQTGLGMHERRSGRKADHRTSHG